MDASQTPWARYRPYGAFLEPTGNNPPFLAQIPNMLHTTYVMFAFLGFMIWEWAKSVYSIRNVLLAGVILVRESSRDLVWEN